MAAPFVAASVLLLMFVAAGCGGTKKGASCSNVATGSIVLALPCDWVRHLPREAWPGARLFAESGCAACHTYRGIGSSNLGAPDLTRAGRQHTRRYFERYVRDPSSFGNKVMPKFRGLGAAKLRQLAIFLAASKGAG